ncbi:hypothetical protein C8T65DRAFT_55561 [Cerioporus squamosus]|nr:hypothetical protein C8T65DRAFT_55561 [Cerioporus squamosus]
MRTSRKQTRRPRADRRHRLLGSGESTVASGRKREEWSRAGGERERTWTRRIRVRLGTCLRLTVFGRFSCTNCVSSKGCSHRLRVLQLAHSGARTDRKGRSTSVLAVSTGSTDRQYTPGNGLYNTNEELRPQEGERAHRAYNKRSQYRRRQNSREENILYSSTQWCLQPSTRSALSWTSPCLRPPARTIRPCFQLRRHLATIRFMWFALPPPDPLRRTADATIKGHPGAEGQVIFEDQQ